MEKQTDRFGYDKDFNRNTMVIVDTLRCPFCGKVHQVKVFREHYDEWCGACSRNIQDVFTELNADEREMLITGICPECWKKMF